MRRFLLLLLALGLLSVGCTPGPSEDLNKKILSQAIKIQQLTVDKQALEEKLKTQKSQTASLLSTAQTVAQLLKDQDMAGLSAVAHPTLGVRFSPYSYVNLQTDLVFTAQQLTGLMQSSQVQSWGTYDGSGEPIQLDFSGYYAKFVYDHDYVNPHVIGNNTLVGTGNMVNNLAQAYPNASFVEFHFNGFDLQYGGMDWTSLRLIFENVGGVWKLIGIQHDGWTI